MNIDKISAPAMKGNPIAGKNVLRKLAPLAVGGLMLAATSAVKAQETTQKDTFELQNTELCSSDTTSVANNEAVASKNGKGIDAGTWILGGFGLAFLLAILFGRGGGDDPDMRRNIIDFYPY